MRRTLYLLAALLIAGSSAEAAGRVVTFRADDGRMLSGLLMEADQRPAPAVVLVPMLGRPKDDWQAVAQRFAEANITALAIDLPGTTAPEDPRELARWSEDIRAAVAYLVSRPDVLAGSIGVAGASLGGSLAVIEAAGDAGVRAIALISPSLDYRGVRIEGPLRAYGARPALLVASAHDSYAARSTRELAQDAAQGLRDIRWSDVAAHGTLLLSRDPDLVRSLIAWFQGMLG
jgi:dienelactone hydrolase